MDLASTIPATEAAVKPSSCQTLLEVDKENVVPKKESDADSSHSNLAAMPPHASDHTIGQPAVGVVGSPPSSSTEPEPTTKKKKRRRRSNVALESLPGTQVKKYRKLGISSQKRADTDTLHQESITKKTGKHLELYRLDSEEPARKNDNFVIETFVMQCINPIVWRRMSCPAGATMRQLHLALVEVFGWSGKHGMQSRHFKDKHARRERTELLLKHSELLEGIDGRVDREGFRSMFDWGGPTKYGASDEIKLGDMVLQRRQWLEDFDRPTLIFEYDFCAHWQMLVQVIGRAAKTALFECVDGQGHPVAEDTGDVQWEFLKDAYQKDEEDRDEEGGQQIHWYETMASNGDPQGLVGDRLLCWDQAAVNPKLRRIKITT